MNLLRAWNVSTSVSSSTSFQISTTQMSSRRQYSLKTVRSLSSQLQDWYTPNWTINYIQVSAKGLHRSPWQFSSSIIHTTASNQPKKKSYVACALTVSTHTSSSNRLIANLKIYHDMIPWRSTSIVLIKEKVLTKDAIITWVRDTKHDGIFVDHVLRDLIINYNIFKGIHWQNIGHFLKKPI